LWGGSHLYIAIDGPAGAGKSTVARMLAGKLKIGYLDTGAMYRAVTLKILQAGTQIEDREALAGLLENTIIDIQAEEDRQRIFLDGEEVTEAIRAPGVNTVVSQVSAIPIVREYLVRQQQEIARRWGDVVMDGRDIGTVVLPDAEYKIYLDASPEERVKRRWKEYLGKGCSITADEVRQEITRRDKIDSGREVSPLKAAPGAMVLDTTKMTLPEVVSTMVAYVRGEKKHETR